MDGGACVDLAARCRELAASASCFEARLGAAPLDDVDAAARLLAAVLA